MRGIKSVSFFRWTYLLILTYLFLLGVRPECIFHHQPLPTSHGRSPWFARKVHGRDAMSPVTNDSHDFLRAQWSNDILLTAATSGIVINMFSPEKPPGWAFFHSYLWRVLMALLWIKTIGFAEGRRFTWASEGGRGGHTLFCVTRWARKREGLFFPLALVKILDL